MIKDFIRIGSAVPELEVGNCIYNTEKICEMIDKSIEKGIKILNFPELCITGYTCADLFHQQTLIKSSLQSLQSILDHISGKDIIVLVGLPFVVNSKLYNCAAVLNNNQILGMIPKSYLPNYSEFYEKRWFEEGKDVKTCKVNVLGQEVFFGTKLLFTIEENPAVSFAVEICEDLWTPAPPSSFHSLAGANIIFNLSASNELVGKYEYRKELVKQQSARCIGAYIYTSTGVFESTTDVVFSGHSLIAEYGGILRESERFVRSSHLVYSDVDVGRLVSERYKNTSFKGVNSRDGYEEVKTSLDIASPKDLDRFIDAHPFVPSNEKLREERCKEIFNIQTSGLAKRLQHTRAKCAVVGISGGLDSTLALLVTAKTFDLIGMDRKSIIAITMPGFGTTDHTYQNALQFMKSLNVTIREVDIRPSCLQHFKDIGHDAAIHDVTYENVQARERTQILMDVANKNGGIVIGTGDMSELALGWCTYNGDHMSMYAVNTGVPKTLVKYLVHWVADNVVDNDSRDVLYRIIDTPISPELLPPSEKGEIQQKTEDLIGPYELHDFFLYYMVRQGSSPEKIYYLALNAFSEKYDSGTIKKWLIAFFRRFFTQQFKRSCLPDGPKVGTISLSPRGDWRMPSDAQYTLWMKELENLD